MPKNLREAETGDSVTVQDIVQFICPFCNKSASTGKDDQNIPYVLHEVPQCVKFEKLEPDKYLRTVREFYQGN